MHTTALFNIALIPMLFAAAMAAMFLTPGQSRGLFLKCSVLMGLAPAMWSIIRRGPPRAYDSGELPQEFFEVWRERLVRHYEACAKRDGYSTWFDWWEANNIRRGFAAHVRECVDQFGTGTAIAAGEELPAGSIGKTLSRTIPRR